jgi:hypothetical protein
VLLLLLFVAKISKILQGRNSSVNHRDAVLLSFIARSPLGETAFKTQLSKERNANIKSCSFASEHREFISDAETKAAMPSNDAKRI